MTTRLSSRSVRRSTNISTHRAALMQRAADMPHDGAAAAAAAGDEDADGGDGRWREPLSLQALSDYTTQLDAAGQGPFSLGHVRLWPINRHSV